LMDITSGVRHPESDIARICRNYWKPDPEANKQLMAELGISHQRFSDFTKDLAQARKKEVNEQIAYALLDPTTTQTEIATQFGYKTHMPISTVKDGVLLHLPESGRSNKEEVEESDFAFLFDRYDWQPPLYNIWNKISGDQENTHFGHFPQHFMRSLLYYHTEPFDTVYDPFAGGGTTIDACRFMMRKFIVSDRKPQKHREEIGEWDIANGLPEWLPSKIHLAFLDPPYWKQAQNKYSEDAEDLANMTLDEYNGMMESLFAALTKHKVNKIAVVISPTQWPNENHKFVDHIFDFNRMLPKYEIEMRYVLPYSTEQYNGNQVKISKESKFPLSIVRDLVVWSRK